MRGLFSIVAGVLILGACSSGHSISRSVVPPPQGINELCVSYGATVHRDASNVTATTAGNVADEFRAAQLNPGVWASQPRNEPVARCEYPSSSVKVTRSNFVACPNHTGARLDTLYFFIDARGHRTAIPDGVLGPPCSRA